MFFCFKQHLFFGVIMIIILISFRKRRVTSLNVKL